MSPPYPWYDSWWLRAYYAAIELIRERYPEKEGLFLETLAPLQTRRDFQVVKQSGVLSSTEMEEVRCFIKTVDHGELELHELMTFRRFVVHDTPLLNRIQRSLIGLVSEIVGEPVEPSYNCLSLYSKLGICEVHIDAPLAKWTLDVCVEQSGIWPIFFSSIQPWPKDASLYAGADWAERVKADPQNQFSAISLEPGESVIFSGSSQWHYREAMPNPDRESFCNLAFFHYVPLGMSQAIDPKNWAALFGIEELAGVINAGD